MIKKCCKCKEPTLFDVDDDFICNECVERSYAIFKQKYGKGAIIQCDVYVSRVVEEPSEYDISFSELEDVFDRHTCEIDQERLRDLAQHLADDEYGTDVDADVEDVDNVCLVADTNG